MKRAILFCLLSIIFFLFNIQCAYLFRGEYFDPLERQTEDGLPVFYIHPRPISDEYNPVTLYYRGEEYKAEARIRGATTSSFPMNSYTLKFTEEQLFNDPEFGFMNKKRVILLTSFNDNSCIRSRLAFDIWNRMDTEHVPVKTYSAVVYLNAKYYGLYTVCERVDFDLLNAFGINNGGELYKAENWDADFYFKNNLHEDFLKTEGIPEHGYPGAYDTLDEFVSFIVNSDSDTFNEYIDEVLDRRDYENWWIFVTFLIASDSCSKNAYHYYNPETDIWRYIPWDFNHSFGQDWKTNRTDCLLDPDYRNKNNIFNRFFEDETFSESIESRYRNYLSTDGAFDLNWIISRIDEYYAEIRDAALNNEKKWQEKYQNYKLWSDRDDFTTFEEEIQYIKNRITQRYVFLCEKYEMD